MTRALVGARQRNRTIPARVPWVANALALTANASLDSRTIHATVGALHGLRAVVRLPALVAYTRGLSSRSVTHAVAGAVLGAQVKLNAAVSTTPSCETNALSRLTRTVAVKHFAHCCVAAGAIVRARDLDVASRARPARIAVACTSQAKAVVVAQVHAQNFSTIVTSIAILTDTDASCACAVARAVCWALDNDGAINPRESRVTEAVRVHAQPVA